MLVMESQWTVTEEEVGVPSMTPPGARGRAAAMEGGWSEGVREMLKGES